MHNGNAIALDLFGTLVEMPVRHHPYRQAIVALGLEPAIVRRQAMTRSLAFAELFPALPTGERVRLEELLAAELSSIRPFPEVPDTLEKLHAQGYRLCVISNLASPYVAAMEKLPRHLFGAEVMSCEVGAIKPEAAIYQEAARRMKVPAEAMVMVGDRIDNDVTGALTAGLGKALWLNRSDCPAAVTSIGGLDELLKLLIAS